MELWKPFRDNPKYSVSNFGRFWSANIGIMKTPNMNTGYPHLNLMINGVQKRFMVHRVVGEYFVPNPQNKPNINHKNGIRHDNRAENLEWCTQQENIIHSFDVLGRKGCFHPKTQKGVLAYRNGMDIILTFTGIRECGRYLGIPYQAVQSGIKKPQLTYFGWKFKLI